ncbi:TonB-dependent receptor [Polaribacter vadi]|uniref:SusC/RagA family TonB-linked outer membrane protein n=1 Tax=Polaribacter vadi TaxID=1774273 RepID=UPI0030EF421E|tara:strand:+ start:53649 stop:56792 length:3144 start_codon:yes stop_codon:yes gene_type:complete
MKIRNVTTQKKIANKCLLLFALLCLSLGTNAQTITVSGTITDSEDKLPIPGVSILVQGTQKGQSSDFDGKFTITVKVGDILLFSAIGMESKGLKVKGPTMDVELKPSTESLDEIVVIGYGTQKKKELTGAVGQIKAAQMEQVITADLTQALQGQIAGVSVTANSGEPGEGAGILIRGVSSLTGSNDPLFVVDGVPQSGNPGLNPNEIETIDVLKDAASASIYGTRAAGGVILITTKKGKVGELSVDFNMTSGIQTITREISLLNTREQIFVDLNSFAPGRNQRTVASNNRFSLLNDVDFREVAYNDNAIINRYNLSVSGGSADLRHSLTVGYFQQEGVVINSDFDRYNLRYNSDVKREKWSLATSLGFTADDRQRPDFSLLFQSTRYLPFLPEIDPNNTDYTQDDNEVAGNLTSVIEGLLTDRTSKRHRFDTSLNFGYKLTDDLELKSLISTVYTTQSDRVARLPFQVIQNGAETRSADDNFVQQNEEKRTLVNWNASLNYQKTFNKKHNFTGLALFSIEQDKLESFAAIERGLLFDGNTSFGGTTSNSDVTSIDIEFVRGVPGPANDHFIKRIGTIGRVLYDYDGKYLFSASLRLDGSNQFAADNRFAFFPSVSAGWNISDEKFWKDMNTSVNSLKLRASIGTTGNDSFAANSYSNYVRSGFNSIFNSNNGSENVVNGFAVTRFANPDVKWEVTTQANVGLDINMFRNKLELTVDYYRSNKKDLLVNLELPSSAGVLNGQSFISSERFTPVNAGNLTNNGIELSARYRPRIGNVRFNILATFAKNVNEVTKLNGNVDRQFFSTNFVNGDNSSRGIGLEVGREAGAFILYKTDGLLRTQGEVDAYNNRFGLNAELGDRRYVSLDGDDVLFEDDDREYAGSALPDFEAGLNISATYKNWYFATNWAGFYGNEVVNVNKAIALNVGRHKELLNQFIPGVNENTDVPTYRGGPPFSNSSNFRGDSDYFVEDASFIRLRNIIVSYSFPKGLTEKLNIEKLNIFANAQNPLTITKYTGFDPEVGGNNLQNKGVDRGNYPITASYNLGLRLNF